MFFPKVKGLKSVRQLREKGKVKEALKKVLELEQGEDLSFKELLSYKLIIADLLRISGNFFDAIEIAEEIYQEFQKIGDSVSSFDALIIEAYSNVMMMNISKSEDIISKAEYLFTKIKAKDSIDLTERESFLVRIKALIYGFKGEIRQCLELNKRAYELAKDTGNKALISRSLNNIADNFYRMKEYDKAIKYAKEAFKVKDNRYLEAVLWTLIEIYVSKGDIKEAKVYLDQLREHSEKFDIKPEFYHYSKAKILKSSLRARDRIKAEDIFKEVAMDNTILGELRILAILNLCDLYLTELRITNDPKIVNEIHPYIQELLSIAKKRHYSLYLPETHLLQAKLSLLILDFKKAKQFLTQAQNIAESYELKRIAMKISYEHDELLRQTKMWENLKTSELSLSERLDLTGLNEQMENMLKRRMIEVPEISKEDPVMLLILTEGGNLLFSIKFIEDFSFEDDILGGFLTTINYIIGEVFSEGLDRAVFGQYTLLMMPLEPYLICYIFKGHSYFAYHKIKNFLESLRNNKHIWRTLDKFLQKSKTVQINSIPSLESLIRKNFVERKNK